MNVTLTGGIIALIAVVAPAVAAQGSLEAARSQTIAMLRSFSSELRSDAHAETDPDLRQLSLHGAAFLECNANALSAGREPVNCRFPRSHYSDPELQRYSNAMADWWECISRMHTSQRECREPAELKRDRSAYTPSPDKATDEEHRRAAQSTYELQKDRNRQREYEQGQREQSSAASSLQQLDEFLERIVDVRFTRADTRMIDEHEERILKKSFRFVPEQASISVGRTVTSRLHDGEGRLLYVITVAWIRNEAVCCRNAVDNFGNVIGQLTDQVGHFGITLENHSQCAASPSAELRVPKSVLQAAAVSTLTWGSWIVLKEPWPGESSTFMASRNFQGGYPELDFVPSLGWTTLSQCRTTDPARPA